MSVLIFVVHISLYVVSKVYGRILMKRIREGTEGIKCEKQCWFRGGRSCVDQVFAARQVCEKLWQKGKKVFWALINLEKVYDGTNRNCLWNSM